MGIFKWNTLDVLLSPRSQQAPSKAPSVNLLHDDRRLPALSLDGAHHPVDVLASPLKPPSHAASFASVQSGSLGRDSDHEEEGVESADGRLNLMSSPARLRPLHGLPVMRQPPVSRRLSPQGDSGSGDGHALLSLASSPRQSRGGAMLTTVSAIPSMSWRDSVDDPTSCTSSSSTSRGIMRMPAPLGPTSNVMSPRGSANAQFIGTARMPALIADAGVRQRCLRRVSITMTAAEATAAAGEIAAATAAAAAADVHSAAALNGALLLGPESMSAAARRAALGGALGSPRTARLRNGGGSLSPDTINSLVSPRRTLTGALLAPEHDASLMQHSAPSSSRLPFVEGHDKHSDRLANLRKSVHERASGGPTTRTLEHSNSLSETPLMVLVAGTAAAAAVAAAAAAAIAAAARAQSPTLADEEERRQLSEWDDGPDVDAGSGDRNSTSLPSSLLARGAYPSTERRTDGSPQKLQAHLGVTVKYLVQFARHIAGLGGNTPGLDGLPQREVTTAEVIKTFILPHTQSLHCKFADLIPKQHVIVPLLYISHSHAGSFAGLVAAVQRFCADNSLPSASTAVFIDIFCINSHAPGMLPECMAALYDMVVSCKHVVVVVDQKGSALSRLWCCYEAWLATLADKAAAALPVTVSSAVAAPRIDKLQVMYDSVDLEALLEVFSALDLARLWVTSDADRRAIEAHAVLNKYQAADVAPLSGMLPATHAALLAVTKSDYVSACKTRSKRPTRYIESVLRHAFTLVLAGLPWDAEKMMRTELLRIKEHISTAQDVVPLLNNMAILLKSSGFHDEAERLCIEALGRPLDAVSSLPAIHADEPLADRMVLVNLEDIMFRRRDWGRAEAVCRKLVNMAQGRAHRKTGPAAYGLMRPLRHLAEIVLQRGQAGKAEVLLRDGLASLATDNGVETAETAACRYSLGQVLQAQSRLAEAIVMLKQCIETRTHLLGTHHALTLEAKVAEAGVLIANKELEPAEKLLEHAYVAAERNLGTRHVVTQAAQTHFTHLRDQLSHMGQDAREARNDHEAELLFRRALHINSMVFCETSERVILQNLVEVVRQQGKKEEQRVLELQLKSAQRS